MKNTKTIYRFTTLTASGYRFWRRQPAALGFPEIQIGVLTSSLVNTWRRHSLTLTASLANSSGPSACTVHDGLPPLYLTASGVKIFWPDVCYLQTWSLVFMFWRRQVYFLTPSGVKSDRIKTLPNSSYLCPKSSEMLHFPEFSSQVPKMWKEAIWGNIWLNINEFRLKWPLKKVPNKSLSRSFVQKFLFPKTI